MNILVTGTAGFIGYHLAKKILNKNNKVIGVDNINNYYSTKLKSDRIRILKKFKKFKFLKVDIRNKEKIKKFFFKNKISIVYHLAAQAGVRHSINNPDY